MTVADQGAGIPPEHLPRVFDPYFSTKSAGRGLGVIMDLTIPGGMGGLAAIPKLLTLDPKAKALVSSGYSDDPVIAEHGKHGFLGTLTKPYRLEDVSQALGKIIAS